MKTKKTCILCSLGVFFFLAIHADCCHGRADSDFASYLMRATFKIQAAGVIGTGFIVGAPLPDRKGEIGYVLVTVTHVFESMKTDKAILHLRKKRGNQFTPFRHQISIRKRGGALWLSHLKADVAVLPIKLPLKADFRAVPIELLATDQKLAKYEIHPGDEVLVLGYPYGVASGPAGFPILRSGRIASYPLTPVRDLKTFLIDFEIFSGNSGGPVFLSSANRVYKGSVHMGMTHMLLGIVSMEKQITEKVKDSRQAVVRTRKISIAVVVHAQFLIDLIEKAISIKF